MKYFSNILANTIVALFLLSFGMKSEAEGQCPTGFTPKTLYMNVGGCTYKVDICVKCNTLTGQGSEVFINGGITLIPTTPACNPSVPYSGVVNYVISQINTPSFFHNELCPNVPNSPPCDGPLAPVRVTYTSFLCWKAKVILYAGERTLNFTPCSEDICPITYDICVDAGGNYIRTMVNSPTLVVPECDTEAYSITFPNLEDPILFPLDYETPCYIYHSLCNPSE